MMRSARSMVPSLVFTSSLNERRTSPLGRSVRRRQGGSVTAVTQTGSPGSSVAGGRRRSAAASFSSMRSCRASQPARSKRRGNRVTDPRTGAELVGQRLRLVCSTSPWPSRVAAGAGRGAERRRPRPGAIRSASRSAKTPKMKRRKGSCGSRRPARPATSRPGAALAVVSPWALSDCWPNRQEAETTHSSPGPDAVQLRDRPGPSRARATSPLSTIGKPLARTTAPRA